MAMIKCKECGNKISSKAKTCPQCGSPVKKKTNILSLLLIIIILFVCFQASLQEDSDSTDSKPSTDNNSTKPKKPEVLYICRTYPVGSVIENEHIRTAPSTDAPRDETGDLSPHEKIYVLEEKDKWIRFRVTPKDEGWFAWMPKKFAIPVKELIAQREEKFGKCPIKSGSNGSVRVVKEYLRSVAKDPDSLQYDKWSPVYYNESDGWTVFCDYRAKNSFGGYTRDANWFVIRHGRVVAVEDADMYSF